MEKNNKESMKLCINPLDEYFENDEFLCFVRDEMLKLINQPLRIIDIDYFDILANTYYLLLSYHHNKTPHKERAEGLKQ